MGMQGDWLCAYTVIQSLPCWITLTYTNWASLMYILKDHIKKTALKIFLIANSAAYTSLSFDEVCMRFKIAKQTAHATICDLFMNMNIGASFDQISNTIVFDVMSASKLLALVNVVCDKTKLLLELNEQAYAHHSENL